MLVSINLKDRTISHNGKILNIEIPRGYFSENCQGFEFWDTLDRLMPTQDTCEGEINIGTLDKVKPILFLSVSHGFAGYRSWILS